MRDLAPHFARRLVFAQPFIDDLAQQIVLGPGEEFDPGDELGRTQRTRLSTSGGPKRVLRGGGASSGIRETASGCSRRQSRSSSAVSIRVPTRPA
jgi:hypothetical protein